MAGDAFPSRDDLLLRLVDAIDDRSVNVPAIKLLLEELRRDSDEQEEDKSGFDVLDNVTPLRRPA